MERLLVYDDRWIGGPLTRDDEGRRVIAQTTKRETSSQSRDTASHYAFLAEFTALFVLGMFIGIAAVLIAFML